MTRLNHLPRRTLCDIISRFDRSLSEEPSRLEALLRDFCGEHRREIFVLVSAVKERVAVDLLSSSSDLLPLEVVLSRLTQRLQDNLGLDYPAARWAVESWAEALGKISGVECETEEVSVAHDHDDPFASQPTVSSEDQLRRAVRAALADSQITDWEKDGLRDLRRRLNISSEQARQIFAEVKAGMGLSGSVPIKPGGERRPVIIRGLLVVALLVLVSVMVLVQRRPEEENRRQEVFQAKEKGLKQVTDQKALEDENRRQEEERRRKAEEEQRLAELKLREEKEPIETKAAVEAEAKKRKQEERRRQEETQRKAEEERRAAQRRREERQKEEAGLAGRYEAVRPTMVLEEPRVDASVIANLSTKTLVNVEGATGDYLKVISKHGRPPGYVLRRDLEPVQGEVTAGIKVQQGEDKRRPQEEKLKAERQKRQSESIRREQHSGLTLTALTSGVRNSSIFPEYYRNYTHGFEIVWGAVHRVLQEGKDQITRSDQHSGIIVTNLTRHWEGVFPRYLQYYILVQEAADGTTKLSFKVFTYFESVMQSGVLKPSTNSPDYAKRFIAQVENAVAQVK